jgi:3-methyladenine DNA glycosylase AlkD
MARYGIRSKKVLGVSMPLLRAMVRKIGKDHRLAGQLWATGILEARLLASMIDVPSEVPQEQMESWAADFDNWAVCDGVCSNLFDKTPWAYPKALAWSRREEEFVKRAGFSMMAALAVHDKKATNAQFIPFFAAIRRECTDERNFVRKAVNWALRQIAKSRPALRNAAIELAREIRQLDSKAARWIAADALRELTAVGKRN